MQSNLTLRKDENMNIDFKKIGLSFVFDVALFAILYVLYYFLNDFSYQAFSFALLVVVLLFYVVVLIPLYSYFKLLLMNVFKKSKLNIRDVLQLSKLNLVLLLIFLVLSFIINLIISSMASSRIATFVILAPFLLLFYLYYNIAHFNFDMGFKSLRLSFFSVFKNLKLLLFDVIYTALLFGLYALISYGLASLNLAIVSSPVYYWISNLITFVIVYYLIYYNRKRISEMEI